MIKKAPSKILFILIFLSILNLKAQDTIIPKRIAIDSTLVEMTFGDTILPKKKTIWQNLKYDGLNILGGIKYSYLRPLDWQKKDYLTAGGVVLGTAAVFFIDEEANEFFTDQSSDIPKGIRDFGWYFGSPQNNYGITGGVYLFGLLTDNEKVRKTGVLMIASATSAGIIQSISKTIVGRARPSAGKGNHHFKPLANESSYRSFPSGHTILSFTTAYAIGKQFKNPWVKSGIYAVGMVAPVSRLWEGKHWLTDVGLSMALSVAVVDGIDNYLKKEKKYSYADKDKIRWNLNMGINSIGVIGSF